MGKKIDYRLAIVNQRTGTPTYCWPRMTILEVRPALQYGTKNLRDLTSNLESA